MNLMDKTRLKTRLGIVIILILIPLVMMAQQTISGTFPHLANQQIKLVGFEGFNTYVIDSVKVSKKGIFHLSFSNGDCGMGYLATEDGQSFIVLLTPGENLNLEGEDLEFSEALVITFGKQNRIFLQYAAEHPLREQALSAWVFLDRIYRQDSLFAIHKIPSIAIEQEMLRIKEEEEAFLASLDPDTYISWFLPLRKLVSSVPTIALYRIHEIPSTIAAFRKIDFTDTRLWKSGLLRETIEAHFWLIENSGRPLDSVFVEMNISIDHMVENLLEDGDKFNEITAYLFNLLEQRSLFGASEYLALKVLNEVSCTLENDLAAQLESYRAMKIGNTASDFEFPQDYFAPGYQTGGAPKKLSDIDTPFTLVVFAAGWCPACLGELLQMAGMYETWRKNGVEVVLTSLDEDNQAFNDFTKDFPFISICDYQKWDSPIVKAWYVFATPTMYLLGSNREILLRPGSFRQMNAWVDWFLLQGNL
jgi:thiol-disulfide isomerase/thioredoxin